MIMLNFWFDWVTKLWWVPALHLCKMRDIFTYLETVHVRNAKLGWSRKVAWWGSAILGSMPSVDTEGKVIQNADMLWRWLLLRVVGICSSICLEVMHFLPKVLILYLASSGTKIKRNHFAIAIPNCTVPYNVCNWNECSWTQVYQMNWWQFNCKFKLHMLLF